MRRNRPPPPPGKVYPSPRGRRNGWRWWPARYSWDEMAIHHLFRRRHRDAWNDDVERDFLRVEYAA